ncbi:uncharacterized protein LOC142575689 isoform X2 [Dermacentor variabilis]|uniref:uncharacterized protein LOC142575689 isoform X2 n=1 Tax=Dermacentor variabilis TaxID=34621 RepID=UPI003F5BB9C3
MRITTCGDLQKEWHHPALCRPSGTKQGHHQRLSTALREELLHMLNGKEGKSYCSLPETFLMGMAEDDLRVLPWISRQCLCLPCRQYWQTSHMACVGDLRSAGGPVSSVCRSLDIAESVCATRGAPSVLLGATTEEQECVRPAHRLECATSRDVVGVVRLRTQ